ncbi:MAG: methionine synthase, partial [Duncaniella sp.]|nr:methionine synthase [Duncaniella sp.]
MIKCQLTADELGITPADIYDQMGYGSNLPDPMTVRETEAMLEETLKIIHPLFCFFISDGTLDETGHILSVMGQDFSIGRIISLQLRKSERYAFFVATAGTEFEEFQHQLAAQNDMVRIYIADAIGSVIAEKAADKMEQELERLLLPAGWHHTNRFSPGYCG